MPKFIITTDSSCDCSISELKDKNIPVIFFNYSDENQTLTDNMNESNYKLFYDNMRSGVVYKTSQINPQAYYDFFKPLLKENLPIIHVSLGSGVSNTINSIYLALGMLKEDFPNCDIRPIDSKIASLGLTIMINKLVELRDAGVETDIAYKLINDQVLNIIALYTTDTLTYFARGGRLSKVEAFLGNALKINPILDCDHNGRLRIVDKVRGSKKAVDQMIKRTIKTVINPEEQTVLVCHADCEEKAHAIGQKLVEEAHFKDYKVYFMGPIIGAHTGPSLIAIFFEGKERVENVESLHSEDIEKLKKELNNKTK